jgi:hypothetical protein
MESNEKIIYSNSFGSVTDKRIILNYKNGVEDLPIGQITSVSYLHKRNNFMAIFSFLVGVAGIIGLITLMNEYGRIGGGELIIIMILILFATLSGIANWIGHHLIIISTGGNNREPLKAEMSKTREGREFVDAVKKTIIR